MPRFAANLSLLFTELPFLERFAAAKAAGFEAVECQFPYDWGVPELRARLEAAQLRLVLHNLPAGDWAAGDRGIACLPARRDEFREGVARAVAYARALGCPQLNCLAGVPPPGLSAAEATGCLVDNLRYAAGALEAAGLRLLLEPINDFDVPGFLVTTATQALAVMDRVGSDNLFLQYDLYHAQRMTGELAATARRHLARIGHIQIADNPGRHEPGTGEIAYVFVLRHLDTIGYTGWVGCEYLPRTTTVEGLAWRNALA